MNFNLQIDDSDKSNVSIFLKKFPDELRKHILDLITNRCSQYCESMEEDEDEDDNSECEKDITAQDLKNLFHYLIETFKNKGESDSVRTSALSDALGVAKEFGAFRENKV